MEYSFTVWAYIVENKILPLAMFSAGCEQLEFVKSENTSVEVSVVSLIQLHSPRELDNKTSYFPFFLLSQHFLKEIL